MTRARGAFSRLGFVATLAAVPFVVGVAGCSGARGAHRQAPAQAREVVDGGPVAARVPQAPSNATGVPNPKPSSATEAPSNGDERLSWAVGIEPLGEALGYGSSGELVGVGRGVILSIAPNDVFTTTRFEVPPKTSFLAQRTSVSADLTLGAYADRDDKGPLIAVFDLRTGARKLGLRPRGSYVTALAFSSDRKRLVSSVQGGGVACWDLATAAPIAQFAVRHNAYGLAFSHDDRLLATGEDLTVRLRDARTGAELHALGPHTSGVEALAFSPDDRILYAGDNAGWLRIWDVQTGRLLRTTRVHEDIVRGVVPLGDGQRFVTASRDGTARLWHRARDAVMTTIVHPAGIQAFALSRDQRQLATALVDGSVRLSDIAAGRELRRIGYEVRSAVLAFPSNDALLIGTKAGARRLELGSGAWGRARGLSDGIAAFAAKDGRLLAMTSDFSFKRYEAKADTYSAVANMPLAPAQKVHFVGPSSPGPTDVEQGGDVIAALARRELFVWTKTGALLAFTRHLPHARDLALAPDGTSVAVAQPASVEVVSIPSGSTDFSKRHDLARQSTGFTAVAFFSDGSQLAAADSLGALAVYDRRGADKLRRTLTAPAVRLSALRTAPGKLWAALTDGSVALVDPRANQVTYAAVPPVGPDPKPFVPIALAASPDDRFVAVGYGGRVLSNEPFGRIASLRLWMFDGARIELVAALTETDAAEGAVVTLDDGRVDAVFADPKAAGRLLRCSQGPISRPLEACAAQRLSPGLLQKRLAELRSR